MSRLKILSLLFLTIMMAGVVPSANASGPNFKVVLSGSSALWNSLAIAAYNSGKCVTGATAPCFHYTSGSNFNLTDTRPALKGGSNTVDTGTTWIVWDSSSSGPNVWVYTKADSVVGQRCYFAQPRCNISVPTFPAAGNAIPSALWGDNSSDSTPPTAIQSVLTSSSGVLVNGAATDIRPEDGLFATCRANSQVDSAGKDVGLGYNSNNAPGACPTTNDSAHLIGSDIKSGYPGSTSAFHVLAYNISGTDPFSGQAIPTPRTVSIGASPIVFITQRIGALATVTNTNETKLQTVFSGSNCDASVFGAPAGTIDVYNREPLSGTFNTVEMSTFWYPRSGVSGGDVVHPGRSQEHGVNATNPMADLPCTSGGARWRAIGTGEEVKSVQNSNANNGHDGIGYTFFSYGNVAAIANSANYGYLMLNSVDPIFHKYGTTGDPGQPPIAGALPAAANLPASCNSQFPCPESAIWKGGLSFPNLRSGNYRSWSVLRLISNGTGLANIELLVRGSQTYAVDSEPDYVPALPVGKDPGLKLLRSHYQMRDGANVVHGPLPLNFGALGDKGSDAGGCILASNDKTMDMVQRNPSKVKKCAEVNPRP